MYYQTLLKSSKLAIVQRVYQYHSKSVTCTFLSYYTQVEITHTTYDNFLVLLEYLYTSHAPLEDGDALGIMVLSNQFCLPRLVTLCEYYISKEVERSISKVTKKPQIDVVGLLLTSQVRWFYVTSL